MKLYLLAGILIGLTTVEAAKPCLGRLTPLGFVCVCNEEYCDSYDPIVPLPRGTVHVYESSDLGKRLEMHSVQFNNELNGTNFHNIELDKTTMYQKVFGFGGAWTDATVLNIADLGPEAQEYLLKSYFSEEGIEYSIARVVISGSDYSERPYSYDDVDGDWNLTQWSLQVEDTDYKIPYIHRANSMSKYDIKYYGSSWAPPFWMKTNNEVNHGGQLLGGPDSFEWKQYARYLLKFFQAYKENGIEFWGMTVQNEPQVASGDDWRWNSCGFTSEMERDFAKYDLGPIFEENGYPPENFTILGLDDNNNNAKAWADIVFNETVRSKYIQGMGVHWYGYGPDRHNAYDQIRDKFPELDLFILATEACWLYPPEGEPVALGSWEVAEAYGHDILLDLLHWVTGWTDWNMVLDPNADPCWVDNDYAASIIVNKEAGEFYKNTQYYAMGHFSKFLPPGSIRIGGRIEEEGLTFGAFVRPDYGVVVIVVNSRDVPEYFNVTDKDFGELKIKVDAHSIGSWVYYDLL